MSHIIDVFNVIIFVSYVALSSSILYVFKAIFDIRKVSLQLTLLFMLWFLFVLTCGVTHITRLNNVHGQVVSMGLCSIFSVAAALLTVVFVRKFNCFITQQIALVEIFRHDNLNSFISSFDVVCTIIDNKVTSGTMKNIANPVNSEVSGVLRPGNVIKVADEYVRISCNYDAKSANSASVIDMMKLTFPHVNLHLNELTDFTLIIGQNVTQEWLSNITQTRIADAKLSLALTTAHDLRTPLTNFELVIGYISSNKSADITELLDEANMSIEVMKSVISQTVDVGRLVSGHILKPKLQDFNIDTLIKRLKLISKAFETDNVPISYNISPDFPKYIIIDQEWMWQICINLVSNAAKYTLAGEIRFTLRKIMLNNNQMFEIEVRDTGIGIPLEKRNMIFEKFATLQTYNVESTGIGLYIVKSKTDLLNGFVTVNDNIYSDSGTIFTVTLPLMAITDRKTEINKYESNIISNNDKGKDISNMLSCLVVDDTASIRRTICKTLEKYYVESAVNGAQALELMKLKLYSVVLMDVVMPMMDGVECVKRIRAWEQSTKRKRQYIIMISANHIDEPLDFDEHLPKPVGYKQLLEIVEKRMKYTNLEKMRDRKLSSIAPVDDESGRQRITSRIFDTKGKENNNNTKDSYFSPLNIV